MRSYGIKVGPKPNMVLRRRGDIETHRGEGCGDRGRDLRHTSQGISRAASNHQTPGRGTEFFPGAFRGSRAYRHRDFRLLVSRTVRE